MDSSERVIESIHSNKLPMKKCQSKAIRLTIDLSQTDKDGCAIFNYQDLVKAEKLPNSMENYMQYHVMVQFHKCA